MKYLIVVMSLLVINSCARHYYNAEYVVLDRGIIIGVEHKKHDKFKFRGDKLFSVLLDDVITNAFDKKRQELKSSFYSSEKDWLSSVYSYKYKIKLASGKYRMESSSNNNLEVGECIEIIKIKNNVLIVGAQDCNAFIVAHNKSLNCAHKKHGPDAPQKTRCAR